jgi:hypothetical protein
MTFKEQINKEFLIYYQPKPFDTEINHAPKRILSSDEKKLASQCTALL